MEKIFNLETIVSVEVHDKQECLYLTYCPFKKSFWGTTKEGFHDIFGSSYTKAELESTGYNRVRLVVEDNKAFYKPYVELTFTSGKNHIREFLNFHDAEMWGHTIAKKGINSQLIVKNNIYNIEAFD